MKTFKQWVESVADRFSKGTTDVSDEHLQTLEKAIKLAFERHPSEVKQFFRGLEDPEINELCADLEKSPSHDKAAELFGGKRYRDPDEVVPPKPDQGGGDIGDV
jgi:hypothetical protein